LCFSFRISIVQRAKRIQNKIRGRTEFPCSWYNGVSNLWVGLLRALLNFLLTSFFCWVFLTGRTFIFLTLPFSHGPLLPALYSSLPPSHRLIPILHFRHWHTFISAYCLVPFLVLLLSFLQLLYIFCFLISFKHPLSVEVRHHSVAELRSNQNRIIKFWIQNAGIRAYSFFCNTTWCPSWRGMETEIVTLLSWIQQLPCLRLGLVNKRPLSFPVGKCQNTLFNLGQDCFRPLP